MDRSAARRATARSLAIDAVSASVVAQLRAAGVRPILLKGPSLAAWLYDDGVPRAYVDTDLLVAPEALADAERILGQLGFERGRPGWQEVSFAWRRPGDDALIDLHGSLFGVGARPETLWRQLAERTAVARIGGGEIEVLNRAGLAFHLALHAAQHGADGGQPLEDLARALERGSLSEWRDAADLAEAVGAVEVFVAGLRRLGAGAAVADRLGLPATVGSAAVRMHSEGAEPLVLGIEHLATTRSWRARVRFLGRKLAPPARELRRRSALASRGTMGLVLAYLANAVRLLVGLPAALLAWRRARADIPQQQEERPDEHGTDL